MNKNNKQRKIKIKINIFNCAYFSPNEFIHLVKDCSVKWVHFRWNPFSRFVFVQYEDSKVIEIYYRDLSFATRTLARILDFFKHPTHIKVLYRYGYKFIYVHHSDRLLSRSELRKYGKWKLVQIGLRR